MEDSDKKEFTGVWIPKHIIENNELKPAARLIYAEIACFNVCTMSNKTLSERAGCSEATASRIIGELKKLGYIKILGFDGRIRKMKSLYDKPIEPTQNDKADYVKTTKQPTQNAIEDNKIENKEITDTQLLNLLNEKTERNFKLLPRGYKNTLDKFTLNEISKALDNLKKDNWHKERLHELSKEYLLRATTIDNFLSVGTSEEEKRTKKNIEQLKNIRYANE